MNALGRVQAGELGSAAPWVETWRPAAVFVAGANSPHTRRAYTTALRQFARSCACDLAAVVEEHVVGFKYWLVERGLAPSTIRHRLSVLRRFFRWCIERGHHPGPNPALGVPLPPRRTGAGYALDGAQVGRLLGAARHLRDRAMLAVMVDCGLRAAEVAALTVDDLVGDRGLMAVRVRAAAAKGGRPRVVVLSARAEGLIGEYLDGRERGVLFCHLLGERALSVRHIHRIVRRAGRAAGLGTLSPHALRRTFATRSLDAGRPLPEVQRQMGHGDMTTTVGYYRPGGGRK